MLHMYLVALTLAAAALIASGCGGSSKTTSTTVAASTPAATTTASKPPASSNATITIAKGKPLTRAQWIAKGDVICGHTNVELSSTTANNAEDFARLLPQAAGYERAEARELSKLVPPPAMASDWAQIVEGFQKFSELSARTAEYARVNNFKESTPIAQAANTVQKQLTAIAKRDGFKVCSLV